MMLRALVLAGGVACGAAHAQALEFKGVPFGAPVEAFAAANPDSSCGKAGCYQLRGAAKKPPYFAGEMVESIAASFANLDPQVGGSDCWANCRGFSLDRVTVTFFPASFPLIADALASKYGRPTEAGTSEFRTVGGAVAAQDTRRWLLADGGEIVIQRYAGSIRSGQMIMSSAAGRARAERERAQQAEKAKKDI